MDQLRLDIVFCQRDSTSNTKDLYDPFKLSTSRNVTVGLPTDVLKRKDLISDGRTD